MKLDQVRSFDELTHKQWIALGTKLGGIKVVIDVLRDERIFKIVTVVRLTNPTPIVVAAIQDPTRLYDRHHNGVWLEPASIKLFDSLTELPSTNERTFEVCDLIKDYNNHDLIKGAGEEDEVIQSVSEVEVTIDQLIAGQENGEFGPLLSNGQSNLFYVRDPKNHKKVLYIAVHWEAGWIVNTNEAGDNLHKAGCRVFRKGKASA